MGPGQIKCNGKEGRVLTHDTKKHLAIVAGVHVIVILIAIFFASREGILGKKMKELSVVLVPKPKQEEVQKKPSLPTPQIKIPEAKPIVQEVKEPSRLPEASKAPTVAPTPVDVPSFQFSDGAKDVISSSDPIQLYKGYIERYIHSQWKTPDDEDKVTDVEITINSQGEILSANWSPNSTDPWDVSIVKVLKKVNKFPSVPPKGFPHTFTVRFDTTME